MLYIIRLFVIDEKIKIKNPDDDYYVSYEIIGTVVCNENPKITLELDTLFYCSLKYDYSEEVVGVDSIKLDTDNIIF